MASENRANQEYTKFTATEKRRQMTASTAPPEKEMDASGPQPQDAKLQSAEARIGLNEPT